MKRDIREILDGISEGLLVVQVAEAVALVIILILTWIMG